MKIKLDENMPVALAGLLRNSDHDVMTVPEENLMGCDDPSFLRRPTKRNEFC